MPPDQRISWAERPWPEFENVQTALVLGLLLEARAVIESASATSWAEAAARYRRSNPLTGPEAIPLRVLVGAYQAEGQRRLGKNHRAVRHLREALDLAEAQAVTDDVTRAELHFIAGKIFFSDRRHPEALMLKIHKRLVFNEDGTPCEVIIPYSQFRQIERLFGLDLDEKAIEDLPAGKDRESRVHGAYLDLDSWGVRLFPAALPAAVATP